MVLNFVLELIASQMLVYYRNLDNMIGCHFGLSKPCKQSICVLQILAHPHTLRTLVFCSAHSHTAHVCFLEFLQHPHPHTSPRPQRQNALYDMHVTYQITPKLVVEFDKSTIIYIERHFKVQRKKC